MSAAPQLPLAGPTSARLLANLGEAVRDVGPAVLVLSDAHAAAPDAAEVLRALAPAVVVVATGPRAAEVAESVDRLFLALAPSASPCDRERSLRAAAKHAEALAAGEASHRRVARSRTDLERLRAVGLALVGEHEQDDVLALVVSEARRITGSDAGRLYLAERDESGALALRLHVVQCDSLPDATLPPERIPVDATSLVGAAASTGRPLRVDDAHRLPPDAPFAFRADLDRRAGYHTRSLLVVPLQAPRCGLVGVLELANKRSDPERRIVDEESAREATRSYEDDDVTAALALAGHAAVSISNARLHGQVDALFEGFLTSAVSVVEQRDPGTSGHSLRVATLCAEIATAVDRSASGPYRDERFPRARLRELRYAALLHDFGKVGVRESVLAKARKLSPVHEERVHGRFQAIRASLVAAFHERRADWLARHGAEDFERARKRLEEELDRERRRVDEMERVLFDANEPCVLPQKQKETLFEVAACRYVDADGCARPFLEPDELRHLTLPIGSLDAAERAEMESHVAHTIAFLRTIPWTEELRGVPEIAGAHHEKLDGSGYPRGLRGDAISLSARILTLADMFDALVAGDRPYKAGMPPERALEVLGAEAKAGRLDAPLFELLVGSGVWRRALPAPRRR